MADKEYHRKWREEHREQVLEASRRHEAKRREKRLAENKIRRLNDPKFREAERLAQLKYRQTHPDRVVVSQKKFDENRKEARRQDYVEHREERKAAGKAYYAANIEKESLRSKLKSERRKAAGVCHNCNNPQAFGSISCENHWFGARATQRLGLGKNAIARGQALKQILVDQDYRCAYTGRPLICGSNASIEHKMPVSKRPDLKSDLNNIEWLDVTVNRMKTDMTREEFLETCALIAERAGIVKRIKT
jgi:hypothetical protein